MLLLPIRTTLISKPHLKHPFRKLPIHNPKITGKTVRKKIDNLAHSLMMMMRFSPTWTLSLNSLLKFSNRLSKMLRLSKMKMSTVKNCVSIKNQIYC